MKKEEHTNFWRFCQTIILWAIMVTLMTICNRIDGQCFTDYKEPVTTIYLVYQPADHGLGLRADYLRIGKLNLYSSASYGTFGVYKQYGLKSHMKLTQGVMYRIPNYNGAKFFVTAGLNYHDIFGTYETSYSVDPLIYNNWSYELGVTLKIKWFALGLRTDVPRWEPDVDAGIVIPLKYKR